MTLEEAPHRLLEWGLLTPEAIVEGRLELSLSARRNLNLRVNRGPEPGLFVKLPAPGLAEAAQSVATEARFYELCSVEQRARAVRRLLPAVRRADPERPLLALELVSRGRSLWQACWESAPGELPVSSFEAAGAALAILHLTFARPGLADDPRLGGLSEGPPVYLELHRPVPEQLRYLSGGQLEILEMVQSEPAITAGLDAARKGWRVEGLIHGDLRWENLLRVDRRPPDPGIRLIDWELVQRGDPAWDLAGVLQDLILFWLLGMSMRPELEVAERLATASRPLAELQPAARALWAGYRGAVRGRAGGHRELLPRAIRYAAARLAQTALEHHSEAERASPLAVLLLQVSANVFADPRRAAAELFGLEPSGGEGSAG